MDTFEETPVYGPHKLTRKEKDRIYQAEFRERNRDRLKEKKRAYDAARKEEMRLGREMMKLMNSMNSMNVVKV